ncbi:hypothetical protein [Paenibacillus sp. WLX2291]|uniref:hypothetical protein n=1 Tax=Paenibacillus sp. WLX2291 TaxID=3296934 RepID=UPI0039846103
MRFNHITKERRGRKILKDAVIRAEAGRERAEVERDEAQSAFQALVNDINAERKEVLESLTGMVSKIKKYTDHRVR